MITSLLFGSNTPHWALVVRDLSVVGLIALIGIVLFGKMVKR